MLARGRTIEIVHRLAPLLACCLLRCSLLDDLDGLTSEAPLAGAAGTEAAAASGSSGLGGNPGSGGAAGSTSAGGDAAGGAGGSPGEGGNAGAAGSGGAGANSGGASASSADAGAFGASRIYWLERGSRTVNVIGRDGSGRATLLTISGGGPSNVTGIALDPVGAKLYFTDELRNRVQQSNFDGSDERTVLPGVDRPFGIDVDPNAGIFYVTQQGATPRIQRASLDGSNLGAVVTTTLQSPYGLAVYAAIDKLYIVDEGLDAVLSSDLDGGNLTNLNVPGVVDPLDISVDTIDAAIYWSERTASGPRIRRANLDGSDVVDLITSLTLPGFSTAAGLEVDVAGRAVYFADGGAGGSILRCNLDGSDPTPIVTNLNDPTGVTLSGP